jgi:hypothetical protein
MRSRVWYSHPEASLPVSQSSMLCDAFEQLCARFCGQVACASCSPNSEEHPLTKTTERCCNQCFGVIEAERIEAAGGLEGLSAQFGCPWQVCDSAQYLWRAALTEACVAWQPDEESDKCKCCDCEFGVFTRKHHCRCVPACQSVPRHELARKPDHEPTS